MHTWKMMTDGKISLASTLYFANKSAIYYIKEKEVKTWAATMILTNGRKETSHTFDCYN